MVNRKPEQGKEIKFMSTIREIADFVGVSKSTVSIALSGKPGVSESMRAKIVNAQEKLKSQKELEGDEDSTISLPRTGGYKTILALHAPILSSTQHFSGILQGIQQGLEPYKAQLNLAINEPELPDEHIASLYFSQPELRPDGIIVFGTDHYEYIGKKTQQLGIPCLFLGVPLPDTKLNFVASDEEAAGYKATQRLLDLGHQEIAFVCGDGEVPATQQRITGYKSALTNAGAKDFSASIFIEPNPEGAQIAVDRFIRRSRSFSAVLFGNNHVSRVGLPAFQKAGIVIPNDLSVIVFDETEFQKNYNPPISTISYPLIRQGIWAVQVLMNHINEPLMKITQIYFDSILSERESIRTRASKAIISNPK
jgi:DNA-binding LacI/PurR family transcriptional regulator